MPNLLVLLGPTASGKTRLAVDAARSLNGEIISADSRQVYRGLDIGSGKDLTEYGSIPYHLIDIAEPGDNFNLFTFLQAFTTAYSQEGLGFIWMPCCRTILSQRLRKISH